MADDKLDVVVPAFVYRVGKAQRKVHEEMKVLLEAAEKRVGFRMAVSLILSTTINRMLEVDTPGEVRQALRGFSLNLEKVKRWNDEAKKREEVTIKFQQEERG
jgi:hypothetical protein